MEIINTNIFIKPNLMIIDINEPFYKDDPMLYRIIKSHCRDLGVCKSDSGRYVRVCMIPEENSHPNFCKQFLEYVIPIELIKNMKEGDSINSITPDGTNIRITANQLGCKYSYLGRFERALKDQVDKWYK